MKFKKEKNKSGWTIYRWDFENIHALITRDENKPGTWLFQLRVDFHTRSLSRFKTMKAAEAWIDRILAGELPFNSFGKLWFNGMTLEKKRANRAL